MGPGPLIGVGAGVDASPKSRLDEGVFASSVRPEMSEAQGLRHGAVHRVFCIGRRAPLRPDERISLRPDNRISSTLAIEDLSAPPPPQTMLCWRPAAWLSIALRTRRASHLLLGTLRARLSRQQDITRRDGLSSWGLHSGAARICPVELLYSCSSRACLRSVQWPSVLVWRIGPHSSPGLRSSLVRLVLRFGERYPLIAQALGGATSYHFSVVART